MQQIGWSTVHATSLGLNFLRKLYELNKMSYKNRGPSDASTTNRLPSGVGDHGDDNCYLF